MLSSADHAACRHCAVLTQAGYTGLVMHGVVSFTMRRGSKRRILRHASNLRTFAAFLLLVGTTLLHVPCEQPSTPEGQLELPGAEQYLHRRCQAPEVARGWPP
jgi:hypothetical protein